MNITDINLTHLKYFIDTVDARSFSVAAKLNYVSRPAISQGIKRLEDFVGTALFHHQKNQLKLTSAGEDFYRKSKASLANFEENFRIGNNVIQSVKLGCSFSLAEKLVLPAINSFKEIPRLEMKVGSTSQIRNYFEQGQINIGVYIGRAISLEGLQHQIVHKGEFVLVSQDAKFSDVLVVTEDRPEVLALKNTLKKLGIEVRFLKAESWTLAMMLAKTVGGSCFVPDIMMDTTQFKKIKMKIPKVNYEAILSSRRNELLTPLEVEYCRFFKKRS